MLLQNQHYSPTKLFFPRIMSYKPHTWNVNFCHGYLLYCYITSKWESRCAHYQVMPLSLDIWNPVVGLSGYTSWWRSSQHSFLKYIDWNSKSNLILKTVWSFLQGAQPSNQVLTTLNLLPAEAVQVPLHCLPDPKPIWSPANKHTASCSSSDSIYLAACSRQTHPTCWILCIL